MQLIVNDNNRYYVKVYKHSSLEEILGKSLEVNIFLGEKTKNDKKEVLKELTSLLEEIINNF